MNLEHMVSRNQMKESIWKSIEKAPNEQLHRIVVGDIYNLFFDAMERVGFQFREDK